MTEFLGDVGTLHCLVYESVPVEAFEEGVLLDLVESSGAALFRLLDQEGSNEILSLFVLHELWECDVVLLDSSVDSIGVTRSALAEGQSIT